jgi:hypothetical protein
MPPKKKASARSKSPKRTIVKAQPKTIEHGLPLLSDTIAGWEGKSFKAPKVSGRSPIDWDRHQKAASDYLEKHNPESMLKGQWNRCDLICYFLLTEANEGCSGVEVQFLLDFLRQPWARPVQLEELDSKISNLIKEYELDLPWLGRWLMFHTNHMLPFVTFDPNNDTWQCRYDSILTDDGAHLEEYYTYSFAKLPPLDISQLARPVHNTDPQFWKDSVDPVMYEFNARLAENLPAFARLGLQAPIFNGENCFDILDREQPGWRKDVENFDIKDGKITPK